MIFRWIVRVVALSTPAYLAISLLSYPDHEPLMIATSILFGWLFVLLSLEAIRGDRKVEPCRVEGVKYHCPPDEFDSPLPTGKQEL